MQNLSGFADLPTVLSTQTLSSMPYNANYYSYASGDAAMLEHAGWVSNAEFRELLGRLCIDLLVQKNRTEAMAALANTRGRRIFDFDTRFPEHERFIYMSHEKLAGDLETIRGALSGLRDREGQLKLSVPAGAGSTASGSIFGGTSTTGTHARSVDDASKGYWVALKNMEAFANSGAAWIDRDKFEQKYKLVWTDPAGAPNLATLYAAEQARTAALNVQVTALNADLAQARFDLAAANGRIARLEAQIVALGHVADP